MTTPHQRSDEHPQGLLDLDADIAREDREDRAERASGGRRGQPGQVDIMCFEGFTNKAAAQPRMLERGAK